MPSSYGLHHHNRGMQALAPLTQAHLPAHGCRRSALPTIGQSASDQLLRALLARAARPSVGIWPDPAHAL